MAPPTIPIHATNPLRRWRRLAPERTALVDRVRGERLSYGELDARVEDWAVALRADGIGFRDIVATLTRNRIEPIVLYFACARVGAALAPMHPAWPAATLARRLAAARPRLIFGEAAWRTTAEAAVREAGGAAPRWLDLDADTAAWIERAGGARGKGAGSDAPLHAEDPALLLHGPGAATGALLPHRQIVFNALATAASWELGAADVAPIVSSLAHTAAWNVLATPLWHCGGTVVLFDGFDADAFLSAAVEEDITVALLAPEQLATLPARPLWGRPGALRFFLSAAPCAADVGAAVRSVGCGVRDVYGLTECGPNCFAVSDEAAGRRPGTLGWPVSFLEARVVGEDGRDAAPEEPGELRLRGAQVFGGYLNDPNGTRAVVDPNGWLRTGQAACRDESGAFFIAGGVRELHAQLLDGAPAAAGAGKAVARAS